MARLTWMLALALMLGLGCGDKKEAPPGPAPIDKPATPPVAPVFEDFPVGVGPCRFVGIKEVSEILGAQLQYLAPEPDDIACHLVPAIGHAAARAPRKVTADEASKEVPDLYVGHITPDNADWSGPPVPGIGEKAAWTGDRLQVLQGAHFFRIAVIDPEVPVDQLKTRVEAVGRKIAARAAAEPATAGSGGPR